MAFCGKCGTKIEDGAKFCPGCGALVESARPTEQTEQQNTQQNAQQPGNQNDLGSKLSGLNNTADTSGAYDAKDISDNKFMAILAYLSLLWLIPFFAKKDSPFVHYHCRQGLNLLIVEVAYTVVSGILSAVIRTPHYIYGVYYGSYTPAWLSTILWLISVPIVILAVLGIVNVAKGKAKELPVIGKFNILK